MTTITLADRTMVTKEDVKAALIALALRHYTDPEESAAFLAGYYEAVHGQAMRLDHPWPNAYGAGFNEGRKG